MNITGILVRWVHEGEVNIPFSCNPDNQLYNIPSVQKDGFPHLKTLNVCLEDHLKYLFNLTGQAIPGI